MCRQAVRGTSEEGRSSTRCKEGVDTLRAEKQLVDPEDLSAY